ncbi:MAG: 50S ribosomal protein L4, partial [Candidatus Dormibacteraceae bacterium]
MNFLRVGFFNSSGAEMGDVELPASIFGETPNMPVMHQAYVRQMANRRQGTAATKTRAEVSGGGRKPHRQKGTGRARQGSIREPQMRGGGVVFGPHPRSYRQSMPRQMRRLALRSALSVKAAERQVRVVEGFDWHEPSSRQMQQRLELWGIEKKALLVLPTANQTVLRSARNLAGVKVI